MTDERIQPDAPVTAERADPKQIETGAISDPRESSPEDNAVASALAHTIDVEMLADLVELQEAADAADTLESLEDEHRLSLIEEMDDEAAAQSLTEMNRPLAVSVLQDLVSEEKGAYASHLLELMAPDDAADLLQHLDHGQRDHLLASIPAREAAALRRLARYDVDSAGGLMTTDFTDLQENLTVAQATEVVRSQQLPREVQHLLVVDDADHLVGVVGLRELLLSQPGARIADIMERSVKAVRADTDQEEVAAMFDRYDYYMLAVVDPQDRLLGIVTVDDVIDIIRAEQTEDVQKTVGAGAGEAVYSSLATKVRSRFPWLLVNLCTSTLAALVVLQFDHLIGELAILAVLMPVIANQSGNAGQQSLAVTLRGLVLDEVRPERVMPLLAREAAVGLINGLIGGLVVGLGVTLLSEFISDAGWQVGLVAAIAMSVSLATGCFVGSSMPILMKRAGFDPATGSTIFLTMTTDTISFLTFLGLAQLLSKYLLSAAA